MKIIVVNDREEERYLAETLLKRNGYEVETAANGAEALEKLHTEDFDMIVSDVLMPVIDGFKLCQECKRDEKLKDIPFVFYTATYKDERDEELSLKLGADKFLTKPIEPEEFTQIIQGIFRDLDKGKVGQKKPIVEEKKEILKLYSERKRAEVQLFRQSNILEGINQVLMEAVTSETEEDIAKTCLAVAEELTESRFGFIAELNEKGLLDTIAISNPGWDACKMGVSDAKRFIKDMPIRGVDRATVRDGVSRIVNGKEAIISHPDHVETPEGHPAITAFLGVPLKRQGKTIGMIGLGNKEKGYDEHDQKAVEDLSVSFVEALRYKRAEEEVGKSRKRFRSLTEATSDGIWEVDENVVYTYASPKVRDLLGYEPDELIGKTPFDLMPPEEARRVADIFGPIAASQKPFSSLENTNLHKDGSFIVLETSGVPVFDEAGVFRGYRGIDRDITERKKTEEDLRNSEKRLAQAVEGNSIPTFLIDNNHFITHWNKSCEKLTGISASAIVGTQKAWSAFYAEERPVMADFIVDGATAEEIAGNYEGKNIKSTMIEGAYEGENFYPDLGEKGKWLFFTAAPLIDQQGKIVGAIETFQDITERRSMEKQLRQSQKMEAIGTLAGGVAHDFNNLLTVIIGNAQLALMDAGKDESLRKKIEEIEKAGDKAASLTQQLLGFSRKQIIKPQVLDLNEEINETEKMFKCTIGEDIEFQTVLEPELWKVYADSGQINQVIMNMVVNARDALPQGGKLIIETANADLDENYFREHSIKEQPGSYVMLAVSDTGIGMDKETREHIFEPFFTTKEVGKGTGLGLSTVYGIVKQNNGFVWVYSEPGQETTFKIYLPKVKGVAGQEEKEQTPVDDLSGSETVLIVEDDDSLRNLAQKVLQSCGYRILSAENGEEALKVGKEHEGPIHLLLTDVVMPKMGGKKAADRLQSLYPQMKVIYMSGYTDNAITRHGFLAPDLNFLEKPFTPKGLARKAREVLDTENEK